MNGKDERNECVCKIVFDSGPKYEVEYASEDAAPLGPSTGQSWSFGHSRAAR